MPDYIDYDEYINQILSEVGSHLSERQQAEVREYYLKHNEYGLAVEELICVLAKEGTRLSVSAKSMLSDLSLFDSLNPQTRGELQNAWAALHTEKMKSTLRRNYPASDVITDLRTALDVQRDFFARFRYLYEQDDLVRAEAPYGSWLSVVHLPDILEIHLLQTEPRLVA